ncbi:hypothetical protein P154DRAFT_357450 [Amniculicola lignicola CBS 123094]|uniref:Uncharacterized protein n=1 Tax=Amniculicola lignicola CBS 123094 TaxID=1392246 RepID=A0A6A5WUC6_9PLEO|nr:hypothetical protein P154DRAFT_357450 [Amniculicola lignicola CBS 123094]
MRPCSASTSLLAKSTSTGLGMAGRPRVWEQYMMQGVLKHWGEYWREVESSGEQWRAVESSGERTGHVQQISTLGGWAGGLK